METAIGSRKYGMARLQVIGADQSGAANGAVAGAYPAVHSIENPMVWLVLIGATTLGLIAFSTSVRVGKFSASVSGG